MQPDAASWRATSNPMPLFAPVTRAIFFRGLPMFICSLPQAPTR